MRRRINITKKDLNKLVDSMSKCDIESKKFKKLEKEFEEIAKKKIAIHDFCEHLKEGDK